MLIAFAVLTTAGPAGAALPAPDARIEVHDHRTPGRNWHVQIEASATGRSLRMIVLYVQQCRQTVFAQRVALSNAGRFEVRRDIDASGGGPGNWRIAGRFTARGHVVGTYELTAGDCTTGVRRFHGHTGGRHGHDEHSTAGTPLGQYPVLARATAARRSEARRVWRATLASAATARLRMYRYARRAGYERAARRWRRPVLFHLRNEIYEHDGRTFDARRPESLVYWWPRSGPPILLAFMYRAPAGPAPSLGSPIIGWHQHPGEDGRVGPTQMTHVWLTRDLRSAFANCLPVGALERAIPRWHYRMPTFWSGPESAPCAASTR